LIRSSRIASETSCAVSRSPFTTSEAWHSTRVARTARKFSSKCATACFRYRNCKKAAVIWAVRRSTPGRPRKSEDITTEKIDFVVTQICDICRPNPGRSAHSCCAAFLGLGPRFLGLGPPIACHAGKWPLKEAYWPLAGHSLFIMNGPNPGGALSKTRQKVLYAHVRVVECPITCSKKDARSLGSKVFGENAF